MCISHQIRRERRRDDSSEAAQPLSEPLAEQLARGALSTLELFGVFLGRRLAIYDALRDGRARTVGEVATCCGIDPRYAREWLEQQAVAGVLVVRELADAPERRRYSLPARNAAALCDEEAPDFVAALADILVGIASALPEVVEAFRTGGGVPYERYGVYFREGQGAINRPACAHDLCSRWLGAIPGLDETLRTRRDARILDVGCGSGFATIALADAYPGAHVIGCDLDVASIEDARRNAEQVGSQARFVAGGIESAVGAGHVDLVLLLEVLHDLADPVAVLSAARAALAPGASVLVVDERVAERFVAPGDDLERLMYGYSISHCLPASMATPNSAALGTVMRPAQVRALAREAGFAACDVLPIEHPMFRLYRLH